MEIRTQVKVAFILLWVILIALTAQDDPSWSIVSAKSAACVLMAVLFGYLFATRKQP